MTEISSMLMDISLFGYYQMFTFANIGPVLDNTVSFKNLTRKYMHAETLADKTIVYSRYFPNVKYLK